MRVLLLLVLAINTLATQTYDGVALSGEPIPLRTIVRLSDASAPIKYLPHGAKEMEQLSERFGIYLLTYTDERSWETGHTALAQHPAIASLQYDYFVDFRNEPNDTFYNRQPNLARMGFPDIWAENTGGITPMGDQIVVAVLDNGFDVAHPDLTNRLWVNPEEIPGDGIDNDGNGFQDDIHGWNFTDDQATLPNGQHGTQVVGIIGAEGNNGIGVTGTSWNNRLMLFAIQATSDIIAAYDYVIDQRQRWQDSNGERGALVVATNASFGVEGQFCRSFPVWAEMYDRMGALGILTAASATNRSWSVDDFGDMPTTCTSDFIIGVTNVNDEDRLYQSSAWGEQSIDLAAAGEGTYSTAANGFYGNFGRTSAAAPYVTGAVALLYSLPCERISNLVRRDPEAAARLMRMAILRGVAPKDGLNNLIVTGGLLDMEGAAGYLEDLCAAAQSSSLTISNIYPNPARGNFQLEFGDPSLGPYRLEFVNFAGQVVRELQLGPETALPVTNTISLDGLPNGAYLLRLSNQREVSVGKLVVGR